MFSRKFCYLCLQYMYWQCWDSCCNLAELMDTSQKHSKNELIEHRQASRHVTFLPIILCPSTLRCRQSDCGRETMKGRTANPVILVTIRKQGHMVSHQTSQSTLESGMQLLPYHGWTTYARPTQDPKRIPARSSFVNWKGWKENILRYELLSEHFVTQFLRICQQLLKLHMP
jgi:hypothetical protein